MKKMVFFYLILLFLWFPMQAYGQQNVPILIYHSIDEFHGLGSKELYVTPENFAKQMVYLKEHGYTLLTLERWQ